MSTQYRPITAITMGDPAGIGPEIVVGTMLSEEIHDCCRPFVIGSIAIMERAAKVLGKELKYNKIEDPSEAKYEFGTVDIIETGDYDTDSIEWGKVQALAGQMAVDWIMKSIELGEAGKIDAVSTAPIHKGAIKLIGVKEPGHTEIYQNVTHSPYALTMFSCHKLRVFFVSRHMSLVDACHYATKDVILEDVINIDKELRKVGIENPLIAVAGLNPHNGDNGLFGREEIDEIEPAVKAAQEKGINAIGPCPADSVFHIGKSGKFDAILSLYHDQGHIACKTLDFGVIVGLIVGKICGPEGFLGIAPFVLIATITNSNGSLYISLSSQFGNATDTGAISILSLNDGPFFTLIALGATGLANIPIKSLIAVLVPLLIGFIWGNLDKGFRDACKTAQPIVTFFMTISIGAKTDIKTILTAGASGIVLGLISAATAVIFFFVINLLLPKKERNAMGAAIGTTALNSAMTPAAVAEADPSMEGMVSMATAQCATASIITLFLCPFITAAFDKWMQKRQKGIYSPEGWAYDKVKAN